MFGHDDFSVASSIQHLAPAEYLVRMRILLVNYEYPPLGGGGGIAHQDVAVELAKRHEVVVLTTHFPSLLREETRNGVRIVRVPVWGRRHLPTATLRSMVTFAPSAFLRGLSLIRQFRPHVINAFFAVPSGLPSVLLGRLFQVPVVLTLVGADMFDPDPTAGIATHRTPGLRTVIRWIIRGATARVAISNDTRTRAQRHHGAPGDITVIPLGLVPQGLPTAGGEGSERRKRGHPFRFVAIGRLIPRKAHQDLLEAIALLERSDVHLDLIGDGPLSKRLQETAVRLGIASRVTFHGAVTEERKWELLGAADAFVSSSLTEGFGIVFLEAMYQGLPIVATDNGGQTDFLLSGEHAILVPPKAPAQLSAALRWMMTDDALRQRLGRTNRAAIKNFLIDRTVRQYEDLFAGVANSLDA